MHDGALPSSFSANIISKTPNVVRGNDDMKAQNKKKAPKDRLSFMDWLRYRVRAEDEEETQDWDEEEFEYDEDDLDDEMPEMDEEDPEEFDGEIEDEEDPEEFDDFDEEKELEFDDEEGISDEDLEDIDRVTGTFSDFYRDDEEAGYGEEYPEIDGEDEYEEEEEAPANPGGFTPGAAVPNATAGGGVGSKATKIDRARLLFKQLMNQPDVGRKEIIASFIDQLDTTESTAISYYERIARELGLNKDDEEIDSGPSTPGEENETGDPMANTDMEMSQDEVDQQNPNEQGIIRTVPNAHLVYKRQQENGEFEELWVYNLGDKVDDAITIRREILSGTDIPRGHTRSSDGRQSYTLQTMGNAQMLHVQGLSN